MLTLTCSKPNASVRTKRIQHNHLNFEAFYNSNFTSVKNSAIYILKDEVLAFDLAQDIFIKIYKNFDQMAGVKSPKAWLSAVTRNMCIDFLRKEKRRKKAELDSKDTVYAYESKECYLEEELLYDKLYSNISTLKDSDKDLINRKYFQEQKISKISVELNISPSAVKMRLQRVRDRVKQAS